MCENQDSRLESIKSYVGALTQTAPAPHSQVRIQESDELPYKARPGPGTQPWQSRPAESPIHRHTSWRDRNLTA